MEDYPIIQAQTMFVARFGWFLYYVVSSIVHTLHSRCESVASICRQPDVAA
jgi:hypothetical protein